MAVVFFFLTADLQFAFHRRLYSNQKYFKPDISIASYYCMRARERTRRVSEKVPVSVIVCVFLASLG